MCSPFDTWRVSEKAKSKLEREVPIHKPFGDSQNFRTEMASLRHFHKREVRAAGLSHPEARPSGACSWRGNSLAADGISLSVTPIPPRSLSTLPLLTEPDGSAQEYIPSMFTSF